MNADTALFLTPFLIAFVLSSSLILMFLFIPFFHRQTWRKGERHTGKRLVSRLGGTAMALAFLLTAVFDSHLVITRELAGFFLGIFLILLFGLWDDMRELGWKKQLFFQVSLTVLVFIFGIHISSLSNPLGGAWFFSDPAFLLPGFFILLVWMLLIENAMNWLDGQDGLCGGVSLITLATIFLLSLKPEVNQPPIALLAVIGLGVVSGFFIFNFHPAKIFAGTVGSIFLGFLVSVLAVIAGTKIATALMVLALPVADALWVIGKRIQAHTSVFLPDHRHLHHQLRALGWSERRIGGFFFIVTACIALIALNTQSLGKFVAILGVLSVIFLLLLFVDRRVDLLHGKKLFNILCLGKTPHVSSEKAKKCEGLSR